MDIATRLDPCVEAVEAHDDFDPQPLLQMLVRYTGLAKRTPRERIVAAVSEEIEDRSSGRVPTIRTFRRDRSSPARNCPLRTDGWRGTTPSPNGSVGC